jgi:hypothetical protein
MITTVLGIAVSIRLLFLKNPLVANSLMEVEESSSVAIGL